MNSTHKIAAINEIKVLIGEYPEYTLGEILFSFLRIATFENGTGKLSDVKELTNEQILNAIESAKTKETAETELFTQ